MTFKVASSIRIEKGHLGWPNLTFFIERADSVFSAPFYIQNLLDGERFPNYQINDPNGFLNSLMQVRRPVHFMFADIFRILISCILLVCAGYKLTCPTQPSPLDEFPNIKSPSLPYSFVGLKEVIEDLGRFWCRVIYLT